MLLLPPFVRRCMPRCKQSNRRAAPGSARPAHWRQALPSIVLTSIMLWAASDTLSPALRAITLLLITSCPGEKTQK